MSSRVVERDIQVRNTRLSDIPSLAPRLRRADINEVLSSSGHSAEKALWLGMFYSDRCLTGTINDLPVCMFGVVPTDDISGAVWLLGTDDIFSIPTAFCRLTRKHLATFHESHSMLFNFVDARNIMHIHWLQWAGFTFIAKHPNHGVEKCLFLEFVKVDTNVKEGVE